MKAAVLQCGREVAALTPHCIIHHRNTREERVPPILHYERRTSRRIISILAELRKR